MVADDGVTAVQDGDRWRWRWRAPWASTTTSPHTYDTKGRALAAGRRWLKELS
jgi:hypothetical protein